MKYVVLVTSPPYSHQGAFTALRFSQALLAKGHRLLHVFFYQDGVYNADAWLTPAEGTVQLVREWQKLATETSVRLGVCITAALQRGIIDAQATQHLNYAAYNLAADFELHGLGEFMQSLKAADRVITFS